MAAVVGLILVITGAPVLLDPVTVNVTAMLCTWLPEVTKILPLYVPTFCEPAMTTVTGAGPTPDTPAPTVLPDDTFRPGIEPE
jgi:hypothetical protein